MLGINFLKIAFKRHSLTFACTDISITLISYYIVSECQEYSVPGLEL